jgi:hypothetical protein
MTIENNLTAKSEIDKYKQLEIVCNTAEEYVKSITNIFDKESIQSKKEGYKGVSAVYKGAYVDEMIKKIGKDMAKVHRDFLYKQKNSEIGASKIIIDDDEK